MGAWISMYKHIQFLTLVILLLKFYKKKKKTKKALTSPILTKPLSDLAQSFAARLPSSSTAGLAEFDPIILKFTYYWQIY